MGPASDPMAVVDPLTMKVHGMEIYVSLMLQQCLEQQMVIFMHLY